MKKALIALLLITLLLTWAFNERRLLAMRITAATGDGVGDLLPDSEEGPNTRWHDDYFTVEIIAPDTIAIGEPRYPYQNFSYLIIGNQRALLFDGGPGERDIGAVARSLTSKPITFLPSHLHFDHVANNVSFERVALLDVPPIRSRADGNQFSPSSKQHLGFMDGYNAPEWTVAEWITPGADYDLGGRTLKVWYTPGHTTDSVTLYDSRNHIAFTGDYIYPGELWAFVPGSSMRDFESTMGPLLRDLPKDVVLLGAHRAAPPGPPILGYGDLEDLRDALAKMRSGELEGAGTWPQSFVVSDRMIMVAEPRWLQTWD